jgi:hypothetical protein
MVNKIPKRKEDDATRTFGDIAYQAIANFELAKCKELSRLYLYNNDLRKTRGCADGFILYREKLTLVFSHGFEYNNDNEKYKRKRKNN